MTRRLLKHAIVVRPMSSYGLAEPHFICGEGGGECCEKPKDHLYFQCQ
jgi:hypothetical protein